MRDYKIRIQLKSATGTRWQSDTIFGHLCWQVAYGALDISMEDFLKPFLDGDPPFVLSDGFPVITRNEQLTSAMPRPLVKMELDEAESATEYQETKKRTKAPYFTLGDFVRVCRGEKPEDDPVEDPYRIMVVPHASLDRNTSTTKAEGEGGFYETISEYLPPPSMLDIYLRCAEGWIEKVEILFKGIAASGFGRDKSVGLGAFEIAGIEEFDKFHSFEGANGFVSISSMVPARDDPADAHYRTRVKYGKLGDILHANPFKRPLLQMLPGAVFKTGEKPREYYGRMVESVAPGKPEAVQNCYGFPVPCRIIHWH